MPQWWLDCGEEGNMSPLKTTAWEASFCEERSWKSDLWPTLLRRLSTRQVKQHCYRNSQFCHTHNNLVWNWTREPACRHVCQFGSHTLQTTTTKDFLERSWSILITKSGKDSNKVTNKEHKFSNLLVLALSTVLHYVELCSLTKLNNTAYKRLAWVYTEFCRRR